MSQEKKQQRSVFRKAVFTRDKFKCKICGHQSTPEKAEQELDAHHIVNRNLMPNGGYIKENGITLCKIGENCHYKAEKALPGFEEETLFRKIGSSKELAIRKAK